MRINELSVFFPLFNEEGNVENTVRKATGILESLKIEYEIILINDGSKDHTAAVIKKLAQDNPKVRVINHPTNLGYGEALKSGFYNARYDTIVYTDGDGQFDFSEVSKFLEKIDEYDLIIGYRIKRQDPLFRILFKEGWKLSVFAFFRLTLKDVDCGFKMVKRSVLEKIPHLESQRGAMINAELVIKAKKAGFKIGQVGVNHYPRLAGKPTGASVKVIVKSYLDLVKLWWELKVEKKYFLGFLLVLFLAAFLRLYKIDQYMTFLGDEGRDALIVRNMILNHHFPLIGPPTSVGNIYLGPLYYYMMFIPFLLTDSNPVSASIMVALFGVATVAMIYYLGKIWFNRKSALIGSFLYAISPVTISYSNFSWNPNPLPFFALFSILGLYKVHKSGNFLWLILTAISIAACLQLHYLAFILIPISLILWGYEIFLRKKYNKPCINLGLGTVFSIVVFLMLMSPLLFFDLRHNFLNSKALIHLFTSTNTVRADLFTNLVKVPQLFFYNLIGRYIAGGNIFLELMVSLAIVFILINSFFKKIKNNILEWPILALGVWLIIGLFGVSFYQQDVYDHYLGFLNPVLFLLLGYFGSFKVYQKPFFNIGLTISIVLLTAVNLQKNPLLYPPNNQLKKTQAVAEFIIQKTNNKDFNFALIAQSNYDSAYRFYLDLYNHKPKEVPLEKTDQLFVVCEDRICDPTHNPKYEVAAFGLSKVNWMEEFEGVKIYRLIANPDGHP